MDRLLELLGSGLAVANFLPIEELIHRDAKLAMALWRDRKADGIRIGRDVPSRAIARLLSRIAICAPVADGEDYRIHLAGSAINHRFGRDITGERLSEIFDEPSEFQARIDAMKESAATGEPRMMRIVHLAGSVELLRYELVVLPVTAPNGKDRWALVFAFYF